MIAHSFLDQLAQRLDLRLGLCNRPLVPIHILLSCVEDSLQRLDLRLRAVGRRSVRVTICLTPRCLTTLLRRCDSFIFPLMSVFLCSDLSITTTQVLP